MRGLCFICNTPSAAMASSVLHRPVESAAESRHTRSPRVDRASWRVPRGDGPFAPGVAFRGCRGRGRSSGRGDRRRGADAVAHVSPLQPGHHRLRLAVEPLVPGSDDRRRGGDPTNHGASLCLTVFPGSGGPRGRKLLKIRARGGPADLDVVTNRASFPSYYPLT